MNKSSFLKKQIVKEAVRSVRKDKKVDEISLLNISRELGVEFSEVTRFYTSIAVSYTHLTLPTIYSV